MKIYASEHEMLNELMGRSNTNSRDVEPEPKPTAVKRAPVKRQQRQTRQKKIAASPVPGVTGAYLNALNRNRNVNGVTSSPVPDVTKAYLYALEKRRRQT